jgi:hypothetical protein
MTFADLYARTVIRRDWYVCGERMLPLRVGHARILEALNLWNPRTWVDLMTCAWVCARPASAFRMPRGWIEKIAWRVRLWRLGGQLFPVHLLSWSRYIDHHVAVPVVAWTGKSGRPGTPPMVAMRANLIGIGYSPDAVDEASMDQALADYYSTLEAEGRMKVTGRTREELEEQIQNARRYVQSLGQN